MINLQIEFDEKWLRSLPEKNVLMDRLDKIVKNCFKSRFVYSMKPGVGSIYCAVMISFDKNEYEGRLSIATKEIRKMILNVGKSAPGVSPFSVMTEFNAQVDIEKEMEDDMYFESTDEIIYGQTVSNRRLSNKEKKEMIRKRDELLDRMVIGKRELESFLESQFHPERIEEIGTSSFSLLISTPKEVDLNDVAEIFRLTINAESSASSLEDSAVEIYDFRIGDRRGLLRSSDDRDQRSAKAKNHMVLLYDLQKIFDDSLELFGGDALELRGLARSIGENIIKKFKNSQIIFRVRDPEMIDRIAEALSQITFVKALVLPPPSLQDLREIADREIVSKKGFRFDQSAWEIFDQQILKAQKKNTYEGVPTLVRIAENMILDYRQCGGTKTVITADSLSSYCHENKNNHWSFCGREKVKKAIDDYASYLSYAARNGFGNSGCAMVFLGAPGTGKTSIARYAAASLKNCGYLETDKIIETRATDLTGDHVGVTTMRVSKALNSARNGCLIIDELPAFGLDEEHSYGREACDTINAFLQEGNRTAIIMLGYDDDVDRFLKLNAGMPGRVNLTINFEPYSRKELYEIYCSLNERFSETDQYLEQVERYFMEGLAERTLASPEFSNGRFCKQLYEKTIKNAVAENPMLPPEEIRLKGHHFLAATQEFAEMKKTARRIGFI